MIVAACVVAGNAYHALILGGDIPDLMQYVGAGNIVAALFVCGAASQGVFNPAKIVLGRFQVRSITLFWSVALLSFASFLFLEKSGPDFSRGTIVVFGILGLGLLLLLHLWISGVVKDALARGTLAGDRAVTLGDRDTMRDLSHTNILQKSGACEIKRYLLPPLTESNYAEGLRVIDEAMQFVRSNSVDCILLALQWTDEQRRDLICERLQAVPIPVLLLPDHHVESIFSRGRELGREFTVEIQRAPLSAGELTLKRTLDLVVAATLLVALAPLFAAVAVIIRLKIAGPTHLPPAQEGI